MIVIKFGGHAMTDSEGLFAKAVQGALDLGEECVIVHGGGPQINAALKAESIEPEFKGGFRVTTAQVYEVVQKVLSGQVLRKVVGQLREAGINAVGLTGRDGGLLIAKKQTELVNGESADLGQVGEVIRVDTAVLEGLIDSGFLPVVAPLASEGDETHEDSSEGLNVNADLAAAAIAGAMRASTLIFMTDVPGIYKKWPDPSTLISIIHADELDAMKHEFAEGMAPKVSACLKAIASGAQSVRVIDGTNPESFALALRGIGGTLVLP